MRGGGPPLPLCAAESAFRAAGLVPRRSVTNQYRFVSVGRAHANRVWLAPLEEQPHPIALHQFSVTIAAPVRGRGSQRQRRPLGTLWGPGRPGVT